MRWTGEADAYLLVKIIESCNVKYDATLIANTWEYGSEKPTPKAITEHMAKLKRLAKENISGNGAAQSPAATTPKKGAAGGRVGRPPKAKTATSATGNKRKRDAQTQEPAMDETQESAGDDRFGAFGFAVDFGNPVTPKLEGSEDDELFTLRDIKKEQEPADTPLPSSEDTQYPRAARAATPHVKKLKRSQMGSESLEAEHNAFDLGVGEKQEDDQ